MAALYADEDVPAELVDELAALGHDVLTALADGRANLGIPDADLLARATQLLRAMLTKNGWDYHRLHSLNPTHAGIITFTDDDAVALGQRIHNAIGQLLTLTGQLIRIIRPTTP